MRLIARAIRTQSRLIWKCLSSSLLSPLFQIKLRWPRCLHPWRLAPSHLRRRQLLSSWGLTEVKCPHHTRVVGCWLGGGLFPAATVAPVPLRPVATAAAAELNLPPGFRNLTAGTAWAVDPGRWKMPSSRQLWLLLNLVRPHQGLGLNIFNRL